MYVTVSLLFPCALSYIHPHPQHLQVLPLWCLRPSSIHLTLPLLQTTISHFNYYKSLLTACLCSCPLLGLTLRPQTDILSSPLQGKLILHHCLVSIIQWALSHRLMSHVLLMAYVVLHGLAPRLSFPCSLPLWPPCLLHIHQAYARLRPRPYFLLCLECSSSDICIAHSITLELCLFKCHFLRDAFLDHPVMLYPLSLLHLSLQHWSQSVITLP